MASLRDIFIRLGVKTDPRGFKRVARGIGDIKASAVIAVAAVEGLAIGLKKIIEVASDIEETANKFGAVFGAASKEVQTGLADIASRTGATNLQLQTMAANIGALIKPALGSAEAAGKMSVGIAELALDIASFNNVSADDAIIALRSGLIGSAEPLQRFGVDTRIAALEQEALRQGISQSVKEMTEGQRVALRYAAIQRQLGVQGATGDATRTALDFANASRNLGDAMKETAGIIGTFFLKSVGGLVNKMRTLTNTFQAWLAENRKLIQQGVDKFLDRASRIIGAVVSVMGRVITATKEWATALGPTGKQLLKIGAIAAGIALLLLLPGAPILLLIALIALVIEDFETWRKGGESVIGDIVAAFDGLIATVMEYREAFIGSIGDLAEWVEEHETGITLVASLVAGLALVIGVGLVKANAAAIISFLALQAIGVLVYIQMAIAAVVAGAASVGAAIAAAAAWIAAAAPLVLFALLMGIIVGTVIFLGIELAKLFTGQTNFFSTMSQGFTDLAGELGGIGPAIGEVLAEAFEFWADFFKDILGLTPDFIDNMGATLRDFWKTTIDFWSGLFNDFFGGIIKRIGSVARTIGGFLGLDIAEPQEGDTGPARIAAATAASVVPGVPVSIARPSSAGGSSVSNNSTTSINVEVRASPGMNERDLAELIPKEIKKAQETQLRQAAQSFVVEAPAT